MSHIFSSFKEAARFAAKHCSENRVTATLERVGMEWRVVPAPSSETHSRAPVVAETQDPDENWWEEPQPETSSERYLREAEERRRKAEAEEKSRQEWVKKRDKNLADGVYLGPPVYPVPRPKPVSESGTGRFDPCRQCGGDGGAGGRCPRCGGNGFEST